MILAIKLMTKGTAITATSQLDAVILKRLDSISSIHPLLCAQSDMNTKIIVICCRPIMQVTTSNFTFGYGNV